MTIQDAKNYLCEYDTRNPYCDLTEEEAQERQEETHGQCYCDNCFTGRTMLAEEIILLLEENKNT